MGKEFGSMSFLADVSSEASSRIPSRIYLDGQKIPIKDLPIGGEKGLEPVLSFFSLAREGFVLNLRSEDVTVKQTSGLLRLTAMDNFSDIFQDLGYTFRPHILDVEARLLLFRHTLATFMMLSRIGIVEFDNLEENGVYNISGKSYWPYKPSVEDIWNLLTELGDTTRKLISESDSNVRQDCAFRAAHFFAASSQIARQVK
jgi:hypothetical protein